MRKNKLFHFFTFSLFHLFTFLLFSANLWYLEFYEYFRDYTDFKRRIFDKKNARRALAAGQRVGDYRHRRRQHGQNRGNRRKLSRFEGNPGYKNGAGESR